MKRRFLPMLLLVLLSAAVSGLTASAQAPEPSGQWKFDNPSDLMAPAKGSLTLSPALVSSPGVADATVSEAGIVTAEGFDGASAILVPATSGLKVTRAEGATASTNFSFMIDLKMLNSYGYNGLFQTNLSNSNDADLFIAKGQIGAGAMGGYVGSIWGDFWYRVVFTNSEGSLKVYVNGDKVIDYATSETRWEIDPTFYLLADEDGEKQDTYVSEVAFWETPLTDAEVKELGSVDNRWVKDLSKINDGDQFFIISDRAKFAGNTTGKAKAMSTIQTAYTVNWGDSYVYWGDLNTEADGYVWTVEKIGEDFAFLNKENGKYLGNMNTGEADIVFSDTPVGYTLTDLTEGAGRFFMTNDDSEHSPHVQGYKMNNRPNNSLAKQSVGDDDYSDDAATCGYPGRWRLLKLNADAPVEPVETGTKIETEADFVAFAAAVNGGQTDLEAYLAADIVLTDNTMVGTSTNKYVGTFDGRGHTITYNYTVGFDYGGLFSYTDGATIKNLRVEGTAVVTKIHFGALLGRVSGTNLIENVITNVAITGQKSGVTGDGGMCGRNDGTITYNYCATLGKMGYEGSSMYSPFNGYSASSAVTTLNNCYTLCELTEGTGEGNCFTLTHRSGTVTINNSYYLNLIGEYVGGTQITAEQVANGELCAMLGNGWYQNIGEDAYPVFDKTHNTVKMITEVGYATMYLPYAVEIPEGVEVFTGEFEEDWLKLNAVAGTVPAFEPVVLKGAAGVYSFAPATTTPDNIEGNVLKGAAEDIKATGIQYILANDEKGVGFYKAKTGTTIKAGKAYLESSSGVKVFLFVEDNATGIEKTLSNSPLKGENIYNVAGQKLSKMQKGINIVNGKKLLK